MSETDATHEHVDLSTQPVKYSFDWWEARNNVGRCKAHRKNGDRCKRPHDPGAVVCGHHGARAPAVRNAARVRLANAADRMAKELLRMATDDKVSDSVKLAAIRDALDRGGLGAKTEIELSAKPYEQLLDKMPKLQGGSRAEWRRAHGIPDDSDKHTPALVAANTDEPVDVEIVFESDQQSDAHPMTPEDDDLQPDEATGPGIDGYDDQPNPFGESDPPPNGLLPLDEAVIRAARINNMGTAGHARLHRPQRALPSGLSGR